MGKRKRRPPPSAKTQTPPPEARGRRGRRSLPYGCGSFGEGSFWVVGWVLFQVERERKAMMAMMMLATTPAAEWAMRLKAIQQMEARAA